MVSTTPQQPITNLKGEQRVVIHHLSWESYLQILHALPNHRRTRLIYTNGTLEFIMPLEDHDFFGRMIGRFIYFLARELGRKIKTIGSTTLNYPDLDKGAELDEGFYIQNQPLVAGKTVDLSQDPPPDLVVEVDITHTDIDKNRLYAAMGIGEFWRFNGQELKIYQLQNQQYIEVETSIAFSEVPKSWLYEFLENSRQDELAAETTLCQHIRQKGVNQ